MCQELNLLVFCSLSLSLFGFHTFLLALISSLPQLAIKGFDIVVAVLA
jgi:hypothetical protein